MGWAGQKDLQKCPSLTKFLPIIILTPLSTQIIHTKSVEFDKNLWCLTQTQQIFQNMWCLAQTPHILSQTPKILVQFHRCRGVNSKHASAENGIWNLAKFQIPLSAEACLH